jgi:uncharacterized protein (TIGR00290 family)
VATPTMGERAMPETTAPTPIVMAWSGGKDSLLALEALLADPQWRVVALVSSVTRDEQRVVSHGNHAGLLSTQAARLRLPIEFSWHDPGDPNDSYELAWAKALARVQQHHGPVSDIAYGDLFLADVRAYRDAQCAAIGWSAHYPLWGQNTRELAERFIAGPYMAVVICVDSTQLDRAFAGHHFTKAWLDDLPASVDPCGEYGEFHTYVTHAPCFSHGIEVEAYTPTRSRARFEYADVETLPRFWDNFL